MQVGSSARIRESALMLAVLSIVAPCLSGADQQSVTIQNRQLSVTVGHSPGTYEILGVASDRPVLQSGVAAEVDHHWLRSGSFPHSKTVQSTFTDGLGKGQILTTTYWGLACPLAPLYSASVR